MKANVQQPWYRTPWPLHFALALLAASWVLLFGSPLETQEKQWFDQCLRWRLAAGWSPAVDPRILHLDITARDLAGLPSTESEYQAAAELIREAGDLGADLIVLDVIYHRGSPAMAQPLIDALTTARGRVVFAEGLYAAAGAPLHLERVRSFPFLAAPLAPSGLINVQADGDGIYRCYHYLHSDLDGAEPSLALAAYFALRGIQWPDEVKRLGNGDAQWEELSADGRHLISRRLHQTGDRLPLLDFRSGWTAGGRAAFPHLSLTDLHALHRASRSGGGAPPLAGKVIFVSYVASGVSDSGATPFGPHQPLVQIHSTALNDLLQETAHRRVPRWVDALVLVSVLFAGLGAALFRPKWALVLFWFVATAAIVAAGIGLIFKTRWVIGSVSLVTLWAASLVAELARRHSCELIARLRLRTTMEYYFSPRVLDRVLANPGSMEPQQVELMVLLTDLRNFTPISERVGTRGVFSLCNQVFEVETQAVLAEDGSLEHFLGDQFLSYWGAPDSKPDGADRALRAAIRLISGMEELRRRLSPEVLALFGYGVALHAGTAMIGNKGSAQRLDYGVMGDLINSAARVESLTKYYGILFLLTREAYSKLSHRPLSRLIDCVRPVGKSPSFELLEIQHPLSSPHFEELAQGYSAAFNEYRQGRFAQAQLAFQELTHRYQDAPSRVLSQRCEEFLVHVPKDWNGVYQFTSK